MLSPDDDTKFMYWVPKKLEFVNQPCVGLTLTLEDENKVPRSPQCKVRGGFSSSTV